MLKGVAVRTPKKAPPFFFFSDCVAPERLVTSAVGEFQCTILSRALHGTFGVQLTMNVDNKLHVAGNARSVDRLDLSGRGAFASVEYVELPLHPTPPSPLCVYGYPV